MDTITPPAEPVKLPEFDVHDDRHQEAYRLRRSGERIDAIAKSFDVNVRTVHRWLKLFEDKCRRSIEEKPFVNLIAEELTKLEDIEHASLREASLTSSELHRRGFFNTALKAIQARLDLMLDVGILPREPTKIYNAIEQLKPRGMASDKREERSEEEIRESIVELLKQGRLIS